MAVWKPIIYPTAPIEAYLAKNYLESEGIETQIQNELSAQVNVIEGIRLLIKESDFEEGVKILIKGGYIIQSEQKEQSIELLQEDLYKDKAVCPYCGSENITSNKASNILTSIAYFIMRTFSTTCRRTYKCNNCEKEWEYINSKYDSKTPHV